MSDVMTVNCPTCNKPVIWNEQSPYRPFCSKRCQLIDLGLIDYEKAYAFQKECVQKVQDGEPQKLILCEHPPVLTLGRMSKDSNFLWDRSEIEKKGVKILPIDRGGEVTLHAPGQIVAYPIFDLNNYGKDLKKFLHSLEQVVINVLKSYEIEGSRIEGKTGVWVKNKKISSLGVGVKKWVSFHGVSLNVNNDLDLFKMIRPCGMDVGMVSMQKLCNKNVTPLDIRYIAWHSFTAEFNLKEI